MSHIAVERNRRRQMNDHLKVLRALTPAFYIKRVDQASIIGGAIEFIRELHTVLEALEAKKKRRLCSPTPSPSPRSLLTCSTPTSAGGSSLDVSPSSNGSSGGACTPAPHGAGAVKELAACCNSPAADVEARISGANVLLRTLSGRIPGQAAKIVALLECLHLEVLQVNISTMDDTVLHSFVLKIGLECQLSVEDVAFEVQQTFCYQELDYSTMAL
ncbi:unnamed protein product [Alopecurus aequalis]